MAKGRDRKVRPPLAYRLGLFFGGLFGLRWVPDNHLGVVYRMEMYYDLRGPGFFWINPFTQSVKQEVNLGPDFIKTHIPSLQTQDAVQLGLRLALAYAFDPRLLPREKALVFVKWSKEIHRSIVTDNAITALQNIMPQYKADEVCRGKVFEKIRENLVDQLTERLRSLALEPMFAMVLEVTVPPPLQNTFTAVANRAAYTHDLSRYELFELNEVRRRELYEVLSTLPGGIRYLNVTGPDVTPQSWQVSRPASPQIIQGQATELPPTPPPQRPKPKSHLWTPTAEEMDDEDD